MQLGSDIDGDASDDYFGNSVSLSADGNLLAAAALTGFWTGRPGYVKTYQWLESAWTQFGEKIQSDVVGDSFGVSVSLTPEGNRPLCANVGETPF